ncbi:DUF445 domain-containing protein [Bacillus weihaiensis]|uniref:DUF445 domain-containing protein n=1 Tax=Bacillus weihaiensis TaxID=1547283 RepID=A0A1L3MUS9_9BACI|nr:DUF445 family protein [Bacillus weihaiensis]APH06079.1 hypothetical protein A9C19_15760 [Bacillus weihaiensis]
MKEIILFLIMIAIGAAIGGITNSLAIKMLFRPYHPVYVFGKRVPFTPGLIPKRRQELANQLGKMVVEHLLTAEGMKRKFLQNDFQTQINDWAKTRLKKFTESEKTVEELLTSISVEDPAKQIEAKLSQYALQQYYSFVKDHEKKTIQELLPSHVKDDIYLVIPKIAQFITDKGVAYFESNEGKQRLGKMIDDFLATRGMLGNMVSMFLGNESLIDKVQPEVLKFLKNQETKNLLTTLIAKEWNHIQDMTIEEMDEKWNLVDKGSNLVQILVRKLGIEEVLTAPISTYLKPNQDIILTKWLPKGIEVATGYLVNNLEEMLKKLNLEDVVREQVESFAVDRLEEMVLSISRREFKMITYLGALLGGIIGGIQGLIVMFI